MTKLSFPLLIDHCEFDWFNDHTTHAAFAMMPMTSKEILSINSFEIQGKSRRLAVFRVYDHLVECPIMNGRYYNCDGYVFVNKDVQNEGLLLYAWLFPMLTK
jgi:hypothetical protein